MTCFDPRGLVTELLVVKCLVIRKQEVANKIDYIKAAKLPPESFPHELLCKPLTKVSTLLLTFAISFREIYHSPPSHQVNVVYHDEVVSFTTLSGGGGGVGGFPI